MYVNLPFYFQILIFLGETALCLNWAIIADILLVSFFIYKSILINNRHTSLSIFCCWCVQNYMFWLEWTSHYNFYNSFPQCRRKI